MLWIKDFAYPPNCGVPGERLFFYHEGQEEHEGGTGNGSPWGSPFMSFVLFMVSLSGESGCRMFLP